MDANEPHQADEILSVISRLAAFQDALRLWRQPGPLCVEGCWLGAVAPWFAAALESEPKPGLLITPTAPEAETVARNLEFLLQRPVEIFPAGSDDPDVDSLLQQESLQRLQVISRLHRYTRDSNRNEIPVIVATLPAIMQAVPSRSQMESDRKSLVVGEDVPLVPFREWLIENGYHSTTAVQLPGECAIRGGIIDVFPPDAGLPVRIEWFDNQIDSIRSFDAVTQRSVERLQRVELLAAGEIIADQGVLLDYLPSDAWIMIQEPVSVLHVGQEFINRSPFPERFLVPSVLLQQLRGFRYCEGTQLAVAGYLGTKISMPLRDVTRIAGTFDTLGADLDAEAGAERQLLLVCVNDGERERMKEVLKDASIAKSGRLKILLGGLTHGFEIPGNGPLLLTVNQLMHRSQIRRATRRAPSRAIDSFLDLRVGDLVVHLAHGIAAYRGLVLLERLGLSQEHLELEFAEGTKIYVPSSKIDLVQRYVGGTKSKPKLAKIGGQSWARSKKAAEAAVTDMAAELLALQAERRSVQGIAFESDSIWQNQFDASFPYEETPDQLLGIEKIKSDMIAARPMDRLICGDVGFGKTELAMRAAFKAIDSGYQVAVLVPTTVLAEQHFKTFRERMSEFPFDIERLSRFRTAAEQKKTLERLAKGQIDVIIGTHRLASEDVKFFNLGLVVVDEEQRFGVAVKERLKLLRPNVDVLTLSATPIPRTLHMSLLGVRDISNLETAPEERIAIETRVVRFDDALIRQAILRELNRGGQIYFVHNRIHDIQEIAYRLQRIAPEASIRIGHGQMNEHELEQVMIDFIDHRFDLLLSTTIIESGLDIPNANTIFVDDADSYGLAELHQLRGRVGRYKHQAHCYLLVPRHKHLTPEASRRLHAIEEYSQIGAGFGIAMRDLEIRGAGNLLGTQQSGHIAAVGYELYCQLLENAVRQMTHQPAKRKLDVEFNLPLEGHLPDDYIPEMRHKIDFYRKLSRLESIGQLEDIRREMLDRFGAPPKPVESLLGVAELRIDAAIWLIRYVGIDETHFQIQFQDRQRIEQLSRLHRGKLKILDQHCAYWPLPSESCDLLGELRSLLQPKS